MQTGLRMDQEVMVRLTDEDLLARGLSVAQKIAYREGLVASKEADARKWNGMIKEADEEIARLGRVIQEAHESRRQGDLFADDVARSALAEVAKRVERCTALEAKACPLHGACSCPTEDGSAIDCPLHGVNSSHGRAAPEPFESLPTEPHGFAFVDDGTEVTDATQCTVCGSEESDPIHHQEAHAFTADLVAPAECGLCRARVGHPIHTSEDEGGAAAEEGPAPDQAPEVEPEPEGDDLEAEETEGDEVQA